eukprot:GILK01002526.1.p1 GENE.GILK01002526.1~~GILK01002526.1.p1  ORF type:complete len:288 (-),score=59.73 GILK01002526.1:190-1053(-)
MSTFLHSTGQALPEHYQHYAAQAQALHHEAVSAAHGASGDSDGLEDLVPEKTLPGFLIKYIRDQGRACSEDEMFSAAGQIFEDLRKPDGTKYKGDIAKSVKGSLYANGLFNRNEDGTWSVKEEEARAYENKVMEKMQKRMQEKKGKTPRKRRPQLGEDGQPIKRKYRKRGTVPKKQEAVLNMLELFSQHLKTEPDWASCFANPFKGCKGTESEQDLWKKLGHERFVGVMQCYTYLKPLLSNGDGDMKKDKMKKAGTKKVKELEETVGTLNSRIANLEDLLTQQQYVQ